MLFLFLHFLLLSVTNSQQAQAIADVAKVRTQYTNHDCTTLYASLTKYLPEGPRVVIKADKHSTRDFQQINELIALQYNVENLFNYQGKWGYNNEGKWVMISPPKPKPETRWQRLKENIERANPDLMTWQEVENFQAAQVFVNQMLGGKYKVILIEGNDSRGIDVALLVKKDLPFDVVARSHREVLENDQKIFSRDFLVTEFRPAGTPETEEPFLEFMVTHNKSQRDSPGDPRSVNLRTAQVKKQAEIVTKESAKHPDVPIFILGDLNADVRTASEFQPLWDIGFKDSFNVALESVPLDKRVTQSYFPKDGAPVYSQLDGILASPSAQRANIIKKMEIIPDLLPDGSPMPLPKSFEERNLQASDHHPVRMFIDFKKIRENWIQRLRSH